MPAKGTLHASAMIVDPSAQPVQLERFGEYISVIDVHKLDLERRANCPAECANQFTESKAGQHPTVVVGRLP